MKENNSVQRYIAASKRNLCIAGSVVEAWPAVRVDIVAGFLERLGRSLKRDLKGWKFEAWNSYFTDSDAGYYIWKPGWEDQYHIVLQCQGRGEQMVYGVMRDEKHIGKRQFSPEILAAVKKHAPSARSRWWWEAVVDLQSPASDWTNPEVLWQMHTDEEFLKDVAEQLLTVAEISAPIIDRLVKKRQKGKRQRQRK